MEAFGLYLLKSAVWLTGFTLVFLTVLRNERYFRLNRIYLLAGIIASVALPFYTWSYAVIIPSGPAGNISISGTVREYDCNIGCNQGSKGQSTDFLFGIVHS